MFAKKIRYGACDGDEGSCFVALLELAKRKGGKPIKFILYRYATWKKKPEIIEVFSREESEKLFPYGRDDLWKRSSRWLFNVSVGGGYQIIPKNVWIKIGRARPRKKRRSLLKFGELSHIYKVKQQFICFLEDKLWEVNREIKSLEDTDNISREESARLIFLARKQDGLEIRIERAKTKKRGIYREMQLAKKQALSIL